MKIKYNQEILSNKLDLGLTIGSFDGVHRGHTYILSEFIEECKKRNLTPVCLSFDPHPTVYIKKLEDYVIDSSENKAQRLKETFDIELLEVSFDENIQKMSGEEFFEGLIRLMPNLKMFYAGHDFGLGKDKSFNFVKTKEFLKKIECVQAKQHKDDTSIFSSTNIRKSLKEGNIHKANYMLGTAFELCGTVVKGSQIGRTLGFPTANLSFVPSQLLPAKGVYFCKCIYDNNEYRSIINIGERPTITDSKEIVVEVHIFDFNKSIYGEKIKISFFHKIRNEKKFSSKDELIKQIEKDKKLCDSFSYYGRFALIGKNIQHSHSPSVYKELLKIDPIDYSLIDTPTEADVNLKICLETFSFISITSPYKKAAFKQCTQIIGDSTLASVNAVMERDGKIIGTNTDFLALKHLLSQYNLEKRNTYILGDGVIASLVMKILNERGTSYKSLSRKQNNLSELDSVEDENAFIINAISREWFPQLNERFKGTFWDLNYNCEYEEKLKENKTLRYIDGTNLLMHQARFALSFWNLKTL